MTAKRSLKKIALAITVLLSSALLAACAGHSHPKHTHRSKPAKNVVFVAKAPPPLRSEIRSTRPHQHAIWMPGYWHWKAGSYMWLSGRWELKPKGKSWISGHWLKRKRGWLWVEGQWRR